MTLKNAIKEMIVSGSEWLIPQVTIDGITTCFSPLEIGIRSYVSLDHCDHGDAMTLSEIKIDWGDYSWNGCWGVVNNPSKDQLSHEWLAKNNIQDRQVEVIETEEYYYIVVKPAP